MLQYGFDLRLALGSMSANASISRRVRGCEQHYKRCQAMRLFRLPLRREGHQQHGCHALPSSKAQPDRETSSIDNPVDTGRKSALGTTDILISIPLFAVAACRWAQTETPVSKRRLSTRGKPRGLIDTSDSITPHSKSVRSYRLNLTLNQNSTFIQIGFV